MVSGEVSKFNLIWLSGEKVPGTRGGRLLGAAPASRSAVPGTELGPAKHKHGANERILISPTAGCLPCGLGAQHRSGSSTNPTPLQLVIFSPKPWDTQS